MFTYPDGRAVSGKRDVDGAVAEVIGLTEKQFKQIAMIAQGDFMKLITEDTGQRREILRHIFKTKNYQTLQEALKQVFVTLDLGLLVLQGHCLKGMMSLKKLLVLLIKIEMDLLWQKGLEFLF